MQTDGYASDILVQGYPGKTVCHVGLGWRGGAGTRHSDGAKGRPDRVSWSAHGRHEGLVRRRPGDHHDKSSWLLC